MELVQLHNRESFCENIVESPLHIKTAFHHKQLPVLVVQNDNTPVG